MRRALFASFFALALSNSLPAAEDGPEPESVHWAFSSLLGTGWYQLSDNRSVYILRIPPRWTLRETELREGGRRQTGLELLLPFTLGYHQLEDIFDFVEEENFSTISVTPGVEFEIPVTRAFWLRPYVKAGYGASLGEGEDTWMFNTGIKSRYRFESDRASWDLLANAHWAAYREVDGGRDDAVGGVLFGVERHHTMKRLNFDAHWHLSYTHLGRELQYLQASDGETPQRNTLDGYFTIGFAVSPPGRTFDFPLYAPHQLGLALEFDADDDYVAIKFNTRSWFTQ